MYTTFPLPPFRRVVFPKKCVWTSSYASRRSVICRDSLLTIVTFAPSFSLLLRVLESRFVPWYLLHFHHLQAYPSLQRDPLIWIKHEVRCLRSLYLPRDQSFSLPHWADSQDLTDAYITFSGTRSRLRIQMSWLKHHLATTLGSISAWRNRLLPLIKTWPLAELRSQWHHALQPKRNTFWTLSTCNLNQHDVLLLTLGATELFVHSFNVFRYSTEIVLPPFCVRLFIYAEQGPDSFYKLYVPLRASWFLLISDGFFVSMDMEFYSSPQSNSAF